MGITHGNCGFHSYTCLWRASSGLMDLQTYRNIGEAYAYVEQIEEYGPGGIPAASLGIWFADSPEAATPSACC